MSEMKVLTTRDAENYIANHNHRNRKQIPARLREGKSIKVFNIFDQFWNVPLGSLGNFFIPACEPGQPYSQPLEIAPTLFDEYAYDMDMNGIKTTYDMIEGLDVAKEVVGTAPMKDRSADLTRWGVFIAAGDEPTETELETAKQKLTATMAALVAEADGIHLQGPLESRNITSLHRKALSYLKQTRDWGVLAKQLHECPACFESINPGSAVCKHCEAVLDDEKAQKYKLGPYRIAAQQSFVQSEQTKARKAN